MRQLAHWPPRSTCTCIRLRAVVRDPRPGTFYNWRCHNYSFRYDKINEIFKKYKRKLEIGLAKLAIANGVQLISFKMAVARVSEIY